MRTWAGIGTLLALGALGTALAQSTSEGLVTRGPTPDLFLLYSGDVIGYVGPCG